MTKEMGRFYERIDFEGAIRDRIVLCVDLGEDRGGGAFLGLHDVDRPQGLFWKWMEDLDVDELEDTDRRIYIVKLFGVKFWTEQ
jgi:hypothetical protein